MLFIYYLLNIIKEICYISFNISLKFLFKFYFLPYTPVSLSQTNIPIDNSKYNNPLLWPTDTKNFTRVPLIFLFLDIFHQKHLLPVFLLKEGEQERFSFSRLLTRLTPAKSGGHLGSAETPSTGPSSSPRESRHVSAAELRAPSPPPLECTRRNRRREVQINRNVFIFHVSRPPTFSPRRVVNLINLRNSLRTRFLLLFFSLSRGKIFSSALWRGNRSESEEKDLSGDDVLALSERRVLTKKKGDKSLDEWNYVSREITCIGIILIARRELLDSKYILKEISLHRVTQNILKYIAWIIYLLVHRVFKGKLEGKLQVRTCSHFRKMVRDNCRLKNFFLLVKR